MIGRIGVIELFIVLVILLLLVGGVILIYILIKNATKQGQIEAYKEMKAEEKNKEND